MEDGMVGGASERRGLRRQRRVLGGRPHTHKVRTSFEEEARLIVLAEQYGVTVPKLLLDSALAGGADAAASNASVRHEVLARMFATHRVLAGVANNLNQIAKATNASGQVQAEMEATLRRMRELAEKVDAFIDEIGGQAA